MKPINPDDLEPASSRDFRRVCEMDHTQRMVHIPTKAEFDSVFNPKKPYPFEIQKVKPITYTCLGYCITAAYTPPYNPADRDVQPDGPEVDIMKVTVDGRKVEIDFFSDEVIEKFCEAGIEEMEKRQGDCE